MVATVVRESYLSKIRPFIGKEAYLLYGLMSQDVNGKKMRKVNEKYDVADHGLHEAVVGANLQNVEIVLENIVGLELLRRGHKVCVGTKEIDLAAERRGEKLYVQVCYLLNDEATIQRELVLSWRSATTIPRLCYTKRAHFREIMRASPLSGLWTG